MSATPGMREPFTYATPLGERTAEERCLSVYTAKDIGVDALKLLDRTMGELEATVTDLRSQLADAQRFDIRGILADFTRRKADAVQRSEWERAADLRDVEFRLERIVNALDVARSTPERGDPEPATKHMRCTRCGADIPSGREAMYTSCDACWREVKANLAEGV